MDRPSHLLVAVDFTECSEHALERALDLAARLGSRVTALHVYSLPVLRVADSDFIPSADEAARVTAEEEAKLDALIAKHARPNVPIARLLRSGRPPVEEINATADELGVEMIVVGTHGRGAIGRAILGSVATDLIRTAKIPVLTVHERRK
jgi:nucleotide-binding universal stress UspA family protein